MRFLLSVIVFLSLTFPLVAQDRPLVRVFTNSFVLPAKFRAMAPLAEAAGVALDTVNVDEAQRAEGEWLKGVDLVILDVPRPGDRARVEEALGEKLNASGVPALTIGGGPPRWSGIDPGIAGRLLGFYAAGGEENFRLFFDAVAMWKSGGDLSVLPAVERLPATGFYHPQAPASFDSIDALLAWGAERWTEASGRVGFVVHSGMVSDMQTALVDALVAASEAAGLAPVVFWFDGAEPDGLSSIVRPARIDVLVNLTHMMNGAARRAEFLDLDIPVLQTVPFREGGAAEWAQATTGIAMHMAAVFLAGPEGWGMSDPIVLSAVENGAEVPLPAQVEALAGKLKRLVSLRRTPAPEKRLAVMFWNYPPGEKNLAASHLNVPASIENISEGLAEAGYDVPLIGEREMIDAGQAMLGALYRTIPLEQLLERDLAEAFPLSAYERWLASLPAGRRHDFSHAGSPSSHWAVREINGVASFIIPRMKRGKLIVMPQMPRGGTSAGAHYHDTSASPDHLYMAAYLYLREQAMVDALVHLGTHGTQEWLAGKDRGLAAHDDPFLAVGDVPVFYPYIQDNVGEALQARRRGRAVTISHQTPAFAPSGLYDELRDIHHLIHEYGQLDEGAVRERVGKDIAEAAIAGGMHADLGWAENAVRGDFAGFLPLLHDHMHELARTAMPLGLHVFGEPADGDHRLATIMQQLGEPFYELVDAEPDELFVDDFSALRDTAPFATLRRYLREGADRSPLSEPLAALLARADELEANLADTGEMEALLAGLEGRFVAPGVGGDPVRNPDVRTGRNLYAFEPDRLPTKAAYEAGEEAFSQLVAAFRDEHGGARPKKIAFSLWSSEAIRHSGVTEAQVLHALGLRPVWDEGGRVRALEIVPSAELGRPRVDVVVQVTSVYRDQFDGFMRLLADGIERIAALDEPDNPVAANTARIAAALEQTGMAADEARERSASRIFSNAPGSYGNAMPHMALASTTWDDDAVLAESFLDGMQFAYGARSWGTSADDVNLFAEQLKGAQAAIMSRSSNLNGVLSTDHPFEFLGGLSLAIRHLDGTAPSLYISDLRDSRSASTTTVARFLSNELRVRYLNPHWIEGMKAEGYAGTLEMLNAANNMFGWQVVDPSTVRADQWQAMFDTYVADMRQLGLDAYFEAHNPTAQAQLMERMIEAIRKGYWDAPEETRRRLARRWQQLAVDHGVRTGEGETIAFVERMARGFGPAAAPVEADGGAQEDRSSDKASSGSDVPQTVSGQVLEEVLPAGEAIDRTHLWLALAFIFGLILLGGGLQLHAGSRRA